MNFKKAAKVVAITSALVLGASACGSDDDGGSDGGTMDLTFGTGGSTGVYFPLGTEYANIFEEQIEGVTVNAVETDAPVENLGKINQGEMQIGFTQNDTANAAVNGEGDFEGAAVDTVGWLGKLYPEAAQIITLEDGGFESIEDLKGKRIAVGPPGSGSRAVADAVLSAHGIEEGDYKAFEEEFGDARALLQDGNLDASISVLGTPASLLTELDASNDVKLLSVDPEIAEQIASETAFEAYTISADTYEFLDEDVSTLSVFASIVASTEEVSEDLAYDLTKVMYENAGDVTLPQGEVISIDEALVGQGDVPLHPGAEKYFKEQGLL